MSALADRSAKRKRAAEVNEVKVDVEVPPAVPPAVAAAVPEAALEVARLVGHLYTLFARDEVVGFNLAFPPGEPTWPSVPAGEATLAALCFGFGADSARNMDGIPDRDPVFINLNETRTIRDADQVRAFLRDAATVADAHYRLRKLGELATLRALLGDAVPAPLGCGYGPVFWYTTYGLQIEYGRHTNVGVTYEPSPQTTARISIYAPGRVPLTADELAAKITRSAPTSPPAAF